MASLNNFFDPFSRKPVPHRPVADPNGPSDDEPPLRGPAIDEPTGPLALKLTGQGTIAVRPSAKELIDIKIKSKLPGGPYIHLVIGKELCSLSYVNASGPQEFVPKVIEKKPQDWCCLEPLQTNPNEPLAERTYWLSIDRNAGTLRYGKYFLNTSQIGLEVILKQTNPKDKDDNKTMYWIDEKRDGWLATVEDVEITVDREKLQDRSKIEILDVPVVLDLSPIITTGDDITLLELETALETVPANLPEACQKLYQNIAGKAVSLNTKEFPDLARAIQYSCETKGCWAYEKLASKVTEFGDNPLETYLRITLGYNQGNSPGVPYVLEIWPSGHFSPIHDHGDACAVIKILYGEIQVTYFDSLAHQRMLGQPLILEEGQITWLGQQNYQIHQLKNVSNDVCCTIQCYSYEKNSNKHEDVFNWSNKGVSEPWTPTSDSTFKTFRDRVMDEWKRRPEDAVWKLAKRDKKP